MTIFYQRFRLVNGKMGEYGQPETPKCYKNPNKAIKISYNHSGKKNRDA